MDTKQHCLLRREFLPSEIQNAMLNGTKDGGYHSGIRTRNWLIRLPKVMLRASFY